ncbi:dTDP-4-dehydrorhamnose 3,5-epimerase [Thiohalocapsa marina]|uniref:dTDP-4-dehydrorhamnose 3,5-epimerase n=1 Tax=Thiohalocapsa marina TaxID=424902 RepID=A0A5M8FIM6_9GAMM|nr:dTDP-4-dehydrorhamnose 3,5-epimerase [Thiohalocapsa marina]KAA6183840.1 dTDP-4-dehydrorhamnose 3,5-epimerase [Thiohalocapsa marina]
MKVIPTEIPEVLIIEPQVFGDARGYFLETWQQERYAQAGIDRPFVQDNQAYSGRGTLRGLHVQNPYPQGKLVQVSLGEVFDVAVDIRRGSPTFGRWVGVFLSGENKRQLWVPEGFLHGYLVTSDEALFSYKCTDLYHPETQFAVRWDDPEIGIAWPEVGPPVLSDKDRQAPRLRDLPESCLPEYAQ